MIAIELAGGPAHAPSTTVEGTVRWDDEDRRDRVVVSLLWFTRGKGTEDVTVVDRVTVDAGAREAPFSFVLPDGPWSFSGTLISVVWAVEASLEPRGDVHREELVVAPGGVEVRV